jgi:hypothetical protein
MGIEFDPANLYILITSPTTDLTALQIYTAAMDWADELQNQQYDPPMGAYGKFGMGGGVYSDSIFVLQDGWKIKFWNGVYQAVITGTLITDDGTPRTVQPDGGNVEITFQVSSQGIVVATGSGVTAQDKIDIGEEVWTNTTGTQIVTDIEILKKIATNRWIITGNQMVIYDDNKIDILYTFDLKNQAGNPTMTEPYERVPV